MEESVGDPANVTPSGFSMTCCPGAAARLMLSGVADTGFISLHTDTGCSCRVHSYHCDCSPGWIKYSQAVSHHMHLTLQCKWP